MKKLQAIAVIIAVAAILVGAAWLGGWVMLVGGIVSIVEAVKASPVHSMGIATGVLRIIGAAPSFWLTIMLAILVGKVFWPAKARW